MKTKPWVHGSRQRIDKNDMYHTFWVRQNSYGNWECKLEVGCATLRAGVYETQEQAEEAVSHFLDLMAVGDV